MFELPPTEKIMEMVMTWLNSHVLTQSTLIQGSAILICMFLAYTGYRMVRPKLVKLVDAFNVSYRIRQILYNVVRLTFPLLLLVMLFISSIIGSGAKPEVNFEIIQAAMSLSVAWVIIRLAVQFLENSFIRNTFALSIWVIAALNILGLTEQTATTLDALGMDVGEFRLSALTVIKALFALFVLLYAATFVSSLLERRIRQIKGLTMTSKVLMTKVVRVVLVTLALLIGVTTAGVDLSLLAVFSGAIGLGIGFGLQKGISNLFSGMLLLLDKSIQPGDIIELQGGTFGWVENMGARFTEIITRDNKSFLVPNEDFITQKVVNWSHGSTLIRIEVEFGVDYSHNPHEIKAMAEEAAKSPDRVCEEPAPVCHFVEFGESSLRFKLRFWIKDAEKGVTNMRAAVMLALWDAFQENGVHIPYPQRVVHLQEKAA